MSQQQLTLSQVGLLIAYAAAMSAGQLLFKAAAQHGMAEPSLSGRLLASAGNGYFIAAVLLYGGLTVLWVWILTFTPLTYAYPFAALAFGLTPLLAATVFNDPISVRVILGSLLIVGGIVVVAT